MNDIKISATPSTPLIETDFGRGSVFMEGDSYPENSFEFYEPLVQWIAQFIEQGRSGLILELSLLYLNTSSIKIMMDIFDMLEDAHVDGKDVAVNWRYDLENERVAELAEEFKEDCTFPFTIIGEE